VGDTRGLNSNVGYYRSIADVDIYVAVRLRLLL